MLVLFIFHQLRISNRLTVRLYSSIIITSASYYHVTPAAIRFSEYRSCHDNSTHLNIIPIQFTKLSDIPDTFCSYHTHKYDNIILKVRITWEFKNLDPIHLDGSNVDHRFLDLYIIIYGPDLYHPDVYGPDNIYSPGVYVVP